MESICGGNTHTKANNNEEYQDILNEINWVWVSHENCVDTVVMMSLVKAVDVCGVSGTIVHVRVEIGEDVLFGMVRTVTMGIMQM